MIRLAMIMRIMRYVSFQPWGSIRADGNRRISSIQRIVDMIWAPDPHSADTRRLAAGSGVLWTPVIIRSNSVGRKILKATIPDVNLGAGDKFGWLASRQPPFHKNIRAIGDASNPLTFNLTDQLRQLSDRLKEERGNERTARRTLEILYDCRFLLRFDVTKMPPEIDMSLRESRSQILVEPYTRWYLPHVVWQRPGDSINLAVMNDAVQEPSRVLKIPKGKLSGWITMNWIRTLNAP
jgi:tRNA(Ile)-lysidine synthase